MEIIELSSEADDKNTNYSDDLIIVSEDAPTTTQLIDQINSGSKEESHSIRGSSFRPSPKRNVLDINNWISSSDDDSFVKDILNSSQQTRLKDAKSPSSKKVRRESLCSSPILESIPEQYGSTQSPEVTSPLQSKVSTQSIIAEKPIKRKAVVLSEEIESCPLTSSPVKRTTKRKKATNTEADKKWREANKATRKKADIMAEMVIEIAYCLKDTLQSEYFSSVFDLPQVRNSYLEVPLISWKRRVEAQYDRTRDVFVPCDLTEKSEKILALYYSPEDLVAKIQEHALIEDITLAKERAQAECSDIKYYLVLLVPEFKEYLRKIKANEDKQYREAVLSQLHDSQRKAAHVEGNALTVDEVLGLITQTEVDLEVNIFFTKSHEETVDWLYSFTYTIGSSLYDKYERNPDFAGVGSTRSGSDQRTSYLEMIKKFNMMTAPKAEKLFQFYTSAVSLYKRFLEYDHLGTIARKNIVPPTVNSSMRRVFTSTDPNQVIAD